MYRIRNKPLLKSGRAQSTEKIYTYRSNNYQIAQRQKISK